MRKIERVIGGAGTGKTSLLLQRMTDAQEELGMEPSQIGFATFTRAGRAEMAKRAADAWGQTVDSLTKEGHFRTVHSTATKQLDIKPSQIIADDVDSREWLSHTLHADMQEQVEVDDDDGAVSLPPDTKTILNVWDYARNKCTPLIDVVERMIEEGQILPSPEAFYETIERYESAKRIESRVDYCDILAQFAGYSFTVNGVRVCEPRGELPEGVRAYFFDECQDNSALVDACCRRLADGDEVEYVLLAGDPFQGIYGSFMGGSASHFRSWDAEESIMPQSYRCPENIMELGERCLRNMQTGYFDRGIRPASHPGVIEQGGDAEEAVLEHCDPRERTLIIARCEYSLRRYESLLDTSAVPFSPRGRDGGAVAGGFRALALLGAGKVITTSEMEAAIDVMAEKDSEGTLLIPKSVRAKWQQRDMRWLDVMRQEDLELIGCTDACNALIRASRWTEVIKPRYRTYAESWQVMAAKWGVECAASPLVNTTTIHGAKGLEADTVILCTQSSKKVERGRSRSSLLHDEECRVLYVAVTRARKKLVIVEDGGRYSLHVPRPFISRGVGPTSEAVAP